MPDNPEDDIFGPLNDGGEGGEPDPDPIPDPEPEPDPEPVPEPEPDPEPEPEPEPEPVPDEEDTTNPGGSEDDEDGGSNVTNPTAPTNDQFQELRGAQASLIRKALGGYILVAPMDVEVPEKLFTGPNEFVDFKALGFEPLGWLSKGDGINFTRETEQAEVESFGAQEPTRIDFTSDVTSAAFRCQETNKTVLEMYHNVDLEGVEIDKDTGEFRFDQPSLPESVYRRVIYVARDGNGENSKFMVKVMPRAIVSEVQEQAWSAESEASYGFTVRATTDDDLGYSLSHRFGGTGFIDLAERMGFTLTA